MTLTKQDLIEIKQILQPEFDTMEEKVKKALQPEFDKINTKISKLTKRVNRGFLNNHKDHNSILKYLDEQNLKLRKRVSHLESHSPFPPLQ